MPGEPFPEEHVPARVTDLANDFSGSLCDHRPTDPAGVDAFTASLLPPDLAEAIRDGPAPAPRRRGGQRLTRHPCPALQPPLAGPHPHRRYLHNTVTHSLHDKVYGGDKGPVIGGKR